MRLCLVTLALFLTFAVGSATATHAPEGIRLVRNSAKTVTVGWNAVPGVTGYGLFVDGTRVSTAGASATQAKFGTPEYRRYVLGVLALKTGGAMSTITVEPRWVTIATFVPQEPTPAAQCADGADNDNDGKTDFPADPGCTSATDNDETNVVTPPPAQCADGTDNDGDGKVDLADPGCSGATDNDETDPVQPPPTGYPNADNTGVPPGTTLTTRSGGFSVNTPGQVIDAINHTSGCIDVYAPGVLIKNSKLRCIILRGAAENTANPRLTVQDSEIVCPIGEWNTGIVFGNYNAYRLDISGCENGLDASTNVTVRDSYIHNLAQGGTLHTDGIQGDPFTNNLIEHNTIYGFTPPCVWPGGGGCNGTSAIISAGLNHGANTTIRNNLMAGGAATLYCPRDNQPLFRVLDNKFSTIYSPKVGEYFPIDGCAGETLSGNIIYETGAPVG